jgi:hypothetical protein
MMFFHFFKIIFDISTSKRHTNHIKFFKKKKFKFFRNAAAAALPNELFTHQAGKMCFAA